MLNIDKQYKGELVKHSTWGIGKVVSHDGKFIVVEYGDENKKHDLKVVISNGSFVFLNNEIQMEVEEAITQNEIIQNEKEKRVLLEVLNKYGFEGFLHTTEFVNFKKIIESGFLVSRAKLIEQDIKILDVSNQYVIDRTDSFVKDCCRFYYYFKTPTNYRAGYEHPVILEFDENIIYYDKVYFSDRNAATTAKKVTSSAKNALDFDWKTIFERGSYDSSNAEITAKRNAEFLVLDKVDISNIKRIYFKYENDMKEAKKFCSSELIRKFYVCEERFY